MVTAIVTILIFLVLISLHEFGHFAAAKASGVGVLEFSIGMGPKIIQKVRKGTMYSLRALPIGGYCRLEGEDVDSDSESAFGNQKLWKRFVVIAAGAVLNILLGFVIFVIIVGMQKNIYTTSIQSVDERAYIAQAGLTENDKIIGINGHKVGFYNDISYYLGDVSKDTEITVDIKRDGKKKSFTFLPSEEKQTVVYDENGASITTSINGIEKQSYITFTDEQKEMYADYIGKEQSSQRYILGFTPKIESVSVTNIFPEAYHCTCFVVKLVYGAIADLFKGETGIEEFSGPVGVAAAVDTAVHTKQYTMENILNLVAMLTINLGLFNLLPIPALDGGRLFFLLIELIFRKPVPPDKEGLVHTIGMLLLLVFAAVVLYNDIMKMFF